MKSLLITLFSSAIFASSVFAAPTCDNGANGDFSSFASACWMPSLTVPGTKSVVYTVTRSSTGSHKNTNCEINPFILAPIAGYDHNFPYNPAVYAPNGFQPQAYCVTNVSQNLTIVLAGLTDTFLYSTPTIPRCDQSSAQNLSWYQTACRNTPLPVELTSFDVKASASDVSAADITWSTASELNSAYFVVEQSKDAAQFSEVARVNAAGNSSQLLQYRTTVSNLTSGTNYFRLVQVDLNGARHVYEIHALQIIGQVGSSKLYPNPVSGVSTLRLNYPGANKVEIQFYSLNGALVNSIATSDSEGTQAIQAADFPASGVYFYRVIVDGASAEQQSFVVSNGQ